MKVFNNGSNFNCPFCLTKGANYYIENKIEVDWSKKKKIYIYTVKCGISECKKISMHYSNHDIELLRVSSNRIPSFKFMMPIKTFGQNIEVETKSGPKMTKGITTKWDKDIDDLFFFHHPASPLSSHKDIPKQISNSIDEAIKCSKMGFLTGGSACIRKALYGILKQEGIPEKEPDDPDKFMKVQDRISLLKDKIPNEAQKYLIDYLKPIHDISSKQVHENDLESFDRPELQQLIQAILELVDEIYVQPSIRQARKDKLDAINKKK